MARTNWEADKMLDVYIYDYLVKRNLQATAKAFIAEGKVATDPVAIDAPGGFLFEWWSIFWDIFHSSTAKASSTSNASAAAAAAAAAAAFIDHTAKQQQPAGAGTVAPPPHPLHDINKSREHQMRLQLLHQHNPHLHTTRDAPPPASINTLNSDVSAVLASKMMQERIRNPNPIDSDASQHLLDANRIALLKSPPPSHTGPMPMQQQQQLHHPRNQQLDIKPDVAMPQRTMPADPSSLYAAGMMHPKPALLAAGLNQGGVGSVPLKGWPLTVPGIDQFRSNLGVQKQLVPSSNQFQLLSPQQQLVAQAQTHNDTRMGSPARSASPNVRSDDPDYLMKLKMVQMQQSGHRPMELQQPHQQNTRKRKPTSSGAANSTGTGNTAGPSPPSTPSTHTPGGGVPVASNVNILQKSSMICGVDATGGLASSSNQMDALDSFVDFDENVDSFLSNDDGDGRDMFAAFEKGSSEHNTESLKGLSLSEIGNNRTSNNKVVCCHFSSDGKLLASAGHEKKVKCSNLGYIW